jgi:hypothetical protein
VNEGTLSGWGVVTRDSARKALRTPVKINYALGHRSIDASCVARQAATIVPDNRLALPPSLAVEYSRVFSLLAPCWRSAAPSSLLHTLFRLGSLVCTFEASCRAIRAATQHPKPLLLQSYCLHHQGCGVVLSNNSAPISAHKSSDRLLRSPQPHTSYWARLADERTHDTTPPEIVTK